MFFLPVGSFGKLSLAKSPSTQEYRGSKMDSEPDLSTGKTVMK